MGDAFSGIDESCVLTTMGLSLGGKRILTCVPTWGEDGPDGIAIESVPEMSVSVATGTISAPRMPMPGAREIATAMFGLHQGQRHLTPAFSSTYIDKPIRTFFAKGWRPSIDLSPKSMMAIAAMMNYALGRSRGNSMGLVERTYREHRHILADLAVMTATAFSEAVADDETGLTEAEAENVRAALSDPGEAAVWLLGVGWLCCWHDHMYTKKDLSSKILREWFSQVESPYKDVLTISREMFLTPEAIAEVKGIGIQCLGQCWVISDITGEVTNVTETKEAWDAVFASEEDLPTEMSIEQQMMRARMEMDAEGESDDDPDDVLPEFLLTRQQQQQLEQLTADDADEVEE